jgi:hypothetical protein
MITDGNTANNIGSSTDKVGKSLLGDDADTQSDEGVKEALESAPVEDVKPLAQILASGSLELPSDTESPDFTAALIALRPLYATRTEFNFMVCDQLALRGVAPNGLNVRNAGRWGNPAAVGADVKAWYAALAARLTAEHARIPEAVKRGANALLEQLWNLAQESSIAPARKQIELLAEDLKQAQDERDRNADLASTRESELRALEQQTAHTESELRAQLAAALGQVEELRAQVRQLQSSIAQAALNHQVELRTQAERYEAQLLAQRQAHDALVREHATELQAAQAALLRERERFDESAKTHALLVDQFRQDIKEGGHRLDKALEASAMANAQADEIRSQITEASIAKARIEQQLAQTQQDVTRLRDRNAQLEQQIVEMKNKAEERLDGSSNEGAKP